MPSLDRGPFAAEALKLAAEERKAAELAERQRKPSPRLPDCECGDPRCSHRLQLRDRDTTVAA